jgi:hypothetical protein
MNIHDIYTALRDRGTAPSLRHFSREFLGKAANYAADRGLGRCSPEALLHLHRRLGEVGQFDLQASIRARLLDNPLPCRGDQP